MQAKGFMDHYPEKWRFEDVILPAFGDMLTDEMRMELYNFATAWYMTGYMDAVCAAQDVIMDVANTKIPGED